MLKLKKKHQVNQETSRAVSVAPLTMGDLKNYPTIKEFLFCMPDKAVTLPRMSYKELETLAIAGNNGLEGLVAFCEHLLALADSNTLEEPLWSLCKNATRLARDMFCVNQTLIYNMNNMIFDHEDAPDEPDDAPVRSACLQDPECW